MRSASLLRQRFPFLGLLAAAVAGILETDLCGERPFLLPVLLGTGAFLLLWKPGTGGIARASVFAGFSLIHFWNWSGSPSRHLESWLAARPGEFRAVGIVNGEPRSHRKGEAFFPIMLESISPLWGGEGGLRPECLAQVRWSGPLPAYGDLVEFRCRTVAPLPPTNPGGMDYPAWLARHGIRSVLAVDPSLPGSILKEGHGNPVMAFAIRARNRMSAILGIGLENDPGVASAIRGICLGVTEGAPRGFTDDFRFTGTIHLFAVSGLHVGMVALILWGAFRFLRMPETVAAFLSVISLCLYVLITGMKMGSIRSAVMASLLLLGTTLLRRSPLLNTLAAAAFLQLLFDTNALFSAGWQFSYSVVGAIVLAAPVIERKLESWHSPDPFLPPVLISTGERVFLALRRHVAGMIAVSASAWIGSLVPTAVYFHLVSLSALGANLLAVPLAFAVLFIGSLSLLSGSFLPWMASFFNNANWLVAKALLLLVSWSSLIPGGHWFLGPPPPPWPELTVLDLRGGNCALLRSEGESSLIDAGRRRDADTVILPCLESLGVNSLKSVLLTRLNARHDGGLEEVASVYRVGTLALPSAEDNDAARGALHAGLETRRPRSAKAFSRFPRSVPLGQGTSMVPAPGCLITVLSRTEEGMILRIDLGVLRMLSLPACSPGVISALRNLPSDQRRCDALLAPLGGAEYASVLGMLREISPRLVVSGSDPSARNGVPGGEWRPLLQSAGISLLLTSECGAVTIQADPAGPRAVPFSNAIARVSLRKPSPLPASAGTPPPR